MNVIGYKESPAVRFQMWNDMLESKRSLKLFKNASDEQRRSVAEMDAAYFSKTLGKYAAA
jgi:hypothetical protein